MRVLALLLSLLLVTVAAPAEAEAAFDMEALQSAAGYSQEDGIWRVEYAANAFQAGSTLTIGLVAEGDVDGDSYPPWGWAEMRHGGLDVAVRELAFLLGGNTHAFTNLDNGEDAEQVYTTWSLGGASLPLFEQLRSARTMQVKVSYDGGEAVFTLKESALAGFRQFSRLMLDTGFLAALDPDMLAYADSLYHGPTVASRPEFTGDGWQQKLQPLPGYAFDEETDTWRLEGLLFNASGKDEVVLGLMFQGPPVGEPYVPWAFAELLRDGQPVYPYQVKLYVDGDAFSYQRVENEDGYIVWTFGHLGAALLERLAKANHVELKLYHPQGVDSYVFQGSGLVSARGWASTLMELQAFDAFEDSSLMYYDVIHIASLEEAAP